MSSALFSFYDSAITGTEDTIPTVPLDTIAPSRVLG